MHKHNYLRKNYVLSLLSGKSKYVVYYDNNKDSLNYQLDGENIQWILSNKQIEKQKNKRDNLIDVKT